MTDAIPSDPDGVLLLVWIHGFKGGADTFSDFPQRVVHSLSAAQPKVAIRSVVYPPYDTRGELSTAVDNHLVWLTEQLATLQSELKDKGKELPVKVVLLGHSMGGLVIADSLLSTIEASWPPVIGIIAFDTPYYGLNPAVFRNTAEKAMDYVAQGQAVLSTLGLGWAALGMGKAKEAPPPATTGKGKGKADQSSSSSSKTVSAGAESKDKAGAAAASNGLWRPAIATAAGLTALAGAAGAAYWKKDALQTSWSWAISHLSFVVELWKMDVLQKRVQQLEEADVGFVCYYTDIPQKGAAKGRTFIALQADDDHFKPNSNTRASDEITAHIEMFTEKSDGMYKLASDTVATLSEWCDLVRKGGLTMEKGKKQ